MPTIREANESDLLHLLSIAERYDEDAQDWDWYEKLDGKWICLNLMTAIHDPNQCVLTAWEEDKLVGVYWAFMSLQAMAPIYITRNNFFYVLPKYRTFDIARGMMRYIEEWSDWRGSKLMAIGCNFSADPKQNRAAELLHKRAGYQSFGVDYIKRL